MVTLSLEEMQEIMRDYQMHHPVCPVRIAEKHNARRGTYMMPRPCECWLKEEPESFRAAASAICPKCTRRWDDHAPADPEIPTLYIACDGRQVKV